MKKLIKYISSLILGLLAKAAVRRYRPKVVMVTGSVGKTSTKDAVAAVLSSRFFVRKSEKSFNSEFGVPFTILGVSNPWHNPLAWIVTVKQAIALLFLPNHYPATLVLEVGSGKPGDLAHILKIVTPDAVVVTHLPEIPVHVEAYSSPEAVREEEFSPAYALAASAPLVVPTSDAYALEQARRTPARLITYGDSREATASFSNEGFALRDGEVVGMRAEVTVNGSKGEVVIKGSVGTTQILPAVAAIATGHAFGISFEEAVAALERYEPPPGRGRLFRGKNGSIIIDDSYNASPVAVERALETLSSFPKAKRRIAVLGDMLELGRYSVAEHERVSRLASEAADVVVSVGIRSRVFAASPKAGVEGLMFDNAAAAAAALTDFVREGDVILVKGSQSIRTERIVEALLADPKDASLLVRQEREWKKKV